MIFFYIAVALLFAYGILFQYYGSWWKAFQDFTVVDAAPSSTLTISVIVPARNEAANIAACLHSICRQQYPRHLLQVIIIDDHSTDDTFAIAGSIHYEGIQIICYQLPPAPNNRAPKKRAIETGIGMASGELVVTTDADCTAGPDWLSSIAACHQQTNAVFIAAIEL